MNRFIRRALAAGSLVAALTWGASMQPAVAEDGAGPEAAAGITWVEGWAEGRAQAKKDGKLIFLYFGRHSPR